MPHAVTAPETPPMSPPAPDRSAARDRRLVSARQRGQTLLEFALTSTIAIAMMLATLQVALIVVQRYGASQVARETARWLAVRIDTTDSAVVTQARTFAAGLPGLDVNGMPSVTVSPSCTALVAGKCPGRSQGDAVSVTVNTSLTPIMFLPTTYGLPPYQIRFPTSMPAITYTVLLE